MSNSLGTRMHKCLFSILFIGVVQVSIAQNAMVIGGTTPNPNAVLTLIGNGSQALIIPATPDHTGITKSPGMIVYNTTDKNIYYSDGSTWKSLGGANQVFIAGAGINITGNTISNSGDTNAADDITTTTTAAGDLSGNFPSPTVAKIRGVNVAATAPAINQVLQYNGTSWTAATLPATTTLPTLAAGQLLTNNGSSNVAVTVSGDATFSQTGALTINNSAISSSKLANGSVSGGIAGIIADGTITNADIATNATIAVSKLAPGSNGQVLTVNAGAATWQTPSSGVTTLDNLTDVTIATPTGGQVLINDGSGQFKNTTISGDVSLSSSGVATIQAGSVTGGAGGKIADGTVTSADLAAGSVSGGAGGIITDATIVNADISATAAISGTKINPDFGAQNIATTGKTVLNTVSYTWPNAQGSANTFLKNDGSGNLAWATTPSPFSTFNVIPKGDGAGLTSSQLFDNGTYVGIGTTTPTHKLTLYTPSSYSLVNFQSSTTGTSSSDGFMIGLDNASGDADIWNWENGYVQIGTNGSQRLIVAADGNVGIGSPSPTAKLEVNGFTKLGSTAPAIKTYKGTGTTSSSSGGTTSISIPTTADKILSINISVQYGAPSSLWFVPPNYTINSGYEFQYYFVDGGSGTTTLYIWTKSGNDGSILGKPVKAFVTYEE